MSKKGTILCQTKIFYDTIPLTMYCMSKKSSPILFSNFIYKTVQVFLNKQYITNSIQFNDATDGVELQEG